MRVKLFRAISFIALFIGLPVVPSAEIASENFRIRSSVYASGGGLIGSANYQTTGTIGQPSPLPDPTDPPFSDSFDLYPGFWYTIGAFGVTCPGDFDGDRDVDGSDLEEYLHDAGGLGLEVFAANFGKENCP
jgi:hypothetical protein